MNGSLLFTILCLAYSIWISAGVGASGGRQEEEDESVDFDKSLRQAAGPSRFERSPDYGAGLGGPLAAVSGPKGGKIGNAPAPAPITAPRTTPAPITAPSDKDRQSAGPVADQCKAYFGSNSKGAITRRKGPNREIKVEKKEKRVLKAIRDGDDKPEDYLALSTVACGDDAKCLATCNLDGCNYFLSFRDRTKSNLTFLYNINEDILSKDENFVKSEGFDSNVVTIRTTYSRITDKSGGTNSRAAQDESEKARRRPVRALASCTPCSDTTSIYCRFLCGGGLVSTTLGVPLGLGRGRGLGLRAASGAGAGAGVASSVASSQAAQAALVQQFNTFSQTYQKSYDSPQAQEQARQNMQANQRENDHANSKNDRNDDASRGITKFSDISYAAFSAHFFGALVDGPVQPVPLNISLSEIKQTPLPRFHWDGVSSSILPPVRYQGSCGSCYAFTVADLVASQNAIERQRALKDVLTEELSVQYLIDCGGSNASVGCKGGRPALLLKNLEYSYGVPFESCYSYKEKAGQCQVSRAENCCQRKAVKFSQLIDISGPHEKEIFANLLNWGLVIAIVGANEQWMFYNGSGVIKARQCDPKVHNHAVIISGYNYNKTTTATPYYIVRNSWGGDWGTNGYAKLEAGKNACGVAKYVLVACTGDCRNVTSAKDLINRSNVPSKYLEKNASRSASGAPKSSSSLSSSSASWRQQGNH